MSYVSRYIEAVQFINEIADDTKNLFNHYPDWLKDSKIITEKEKYCIECRGYPTDCCKDKYITYMWSIYIPDYGEICSSQWVIKLLTEGSFLVLDDEIFQDLMTETSMVREQE